MEDWLNLIGNVGFPIVVAAYLLIRIENKLNELTAAITGLREAIITIPRDQWGVTRSFSIPTGDNGKAGSDGYPPV